jgi:hypothetical protein
LERKCCFVLALFDCVKKDVDQIINIVYSKGDTIFEQVYQSVHDDIPSCSENRETFRARYSEVKKELQKDGIINIVPNADGSAYPVYYVLNVEKFFEIYLLLELDKISMVNQEYYSLFSMTRPFNQEKAKILGKEQLKIHYLVNYFHESRFIDETIEYFIKNKKNIRSGIFSKNSLLDDPRADFRSLMKNYPVCYKEILIRQHFVMKNRKEYGYSDDVGNDASFTFEDLVNFIVSRPYFLQKYPISIDLNTEDTEIFELGKKSKKCTEIKKVRIIRIYE